MKKILLLVMAVAITGIAFATTDPVFSGTFKAWYGYSLNGNTVSSVPQGAKTSTSPIDSDDQVSLELNAVIDDYNTVSISFSLADAVWTNNDDLKKVYEYDDNTGATTITDGNIYEERSDYLRMGSYTLTSDILGALGVDGPVGLKVKFGKFEIAPASVVSVAPKSTDTANGPDGTAEEVGMQFDLKFIDMITLSFAVYPKPLVEKKPEFGVNLKVEKIADMIDFAAYFQISTYNTVELQNDGDVDDDKGDSVGASVAVSIGEMVKIGLGFEYNLEPYTIDEASQSLIETWAKANPETFETKDAMKLQLDTSLTFGPMNIGLSFGIAGFDTNFAKNLKLKASTKYKISDNFSIFGAIGLEDFSGDVEGNELSGRFLYDAGFAASLGKLGIQVAGSRKMDYMSPKDRFDNVIYVMFSTSF